MTTKYNCALDGVSLASLGDRICILDIREDAPHLRLDRYSLPHGGQTVTPVRESLTTRVTFAIQEEQPRLRRAAMQNVLAWAVKGGLLTISDRPQQQLMVVCTELPAMSAEDWTETLTLAFTTTRCPYWEAQEATFLTASSAASFNVPGTAGEAPVSVTVTNTTGETVTRLRLQCGTTWLTFEGIALPAGGQCYVEAANGMLSATINGESILRQRTPGSSDLLLAACGEASSVQAMATQGLDPQPLDAVWKARGRYA